MLAVGVHPVLGAILRGLCRCVECEQCVNTVCLCTLHFGGGHVLVYVLFVSFCFSLCLFCFVVSSLCLSVRGCVCLCSAMASLSAADISESQPRSGPPSPYLDSATAAAMASAAPLPWAAAPSAAAAAGGMSPPQRPPTLQLPAAGVAGLLGTPSASPSPSPSPASSPSESPSSSCAAFVTLPSPASSPPLVPQVPASTEPRHTNHLLVSPAGAHRRRHTIVVLSACGDTASDGGDTLPCAAATAGVPSALPTFTTASFRRVDVSCAGVSAPSAVPRSLPTTAAPASGSAASAASSSCPLWSAPRRSPHSMTVMGAPPSPARGGRLLSSPSTSASLEPGRRGWPAPPAAAATAAAASTSTSAVATAAAQVGAAARCAAVPLPHWKLRRALGLRAGGFAAGRASVSSASFSERLPARCVKAQLDAKQAQFAVPACDSAGTVRSMAWGPQSHSSLSWMVVTGDSKGIVALTDMRPGFVAARRGGANRDRPDGLTLAGHTRAELCVGRNSDHDATVTGLQFVPGTDHNLITTSLDGWMRLHDVSNIRHGEWTSSIAYDGGVGLSACAVSQARNSVLVGTVAGDMQVLDLRTRWSVVESAVELHSRHTRINTIDVCPNDGNVVATAGNDRKVALWDLRKLQGGSTNVGQVAGKVTSAYFSPCGTSILATCDDAKLRVWRNLNLPLDGHCHRDISHLTNPGKWMAPLTAHWHPTLQDHAVVGRSAWYVVGSLPSGTMCRPVDVVDTSTGAVVHQFTSGLSSKLCSLNMFHPSGTVLASASGGKVVCWC